MPKRVLGRSNPEVDTKQVQVFLGALPTQYRPSTIVEATGLTASFLCLSNTAELTEEREFQIGNGLDEDDDGAGSYYKINVDASEFIDTAAGLGLAGVNIQVKLGEPLEFNAGDIQLKDAVAGAGLVIDGAKVLAAGAGDGITVNANDVALTIPGTLTSATANTAAGSHLHEITCDEDGDANVSTILKSGAAGELTLTDLTITADLITSRVEGHLIPKTIDTYDLGSSSLLWREGWISELNAIVFAEQTIQILAGWEWVAHDGGSLGADLGAGDDTCDFGKAMAVGDFVVMRNDGNLEYFEIGANTAGTIYKIGLDASGDRDLDGSGADDWPGGTPFAVLGADGDGRIELNATDTPRIQMIEQGTNYNDQTEHLRFGDLNGDWGYVAKTWGVALGEYVADKPNVTIDTTNGLRIRQHDTTFIQLDASGDAYFQGKFQVKSADGSIAFGTVPPTSKAAGTGIWLDKEGLFGLSGDDLQVKLDATDGSILAGGGDVIMDESGITLLLPVAWADVNKVKWVHGSETPDDVQGSVGGRRYAPFDNIIHMEMFADATTAGGMATSTIRADSGSDTCKIEVLTDGTDSWARIEADRADVLNWLGCNYKNYTTSTLSADGGLVLNQDATAGHIAEFKAVGNVAHGFTAIVDTATYGVLSAHTATKGGLAIFGFMESSATYDVAIELIGCVTGAPSTTKSTGGFGVINLSANEDSSNDRTNCITDANLVSIADYVSVRFIFDKEGEMHSDAIIGAGNDWDEWDDLALASDLSRLTTGKHDEMLKYNARAFEDAGLVTLSEDEEGTHAFIKHKAMLMFSMNVFRDVHHRMAAQDARMAKQEQALLRLGVAV